MGNKTKFTLFHRILHWIIALAMMILFATGFLRMNWMNKHQIISVIEKNTEENQIQKEQIQKIAKDIREPMWQWHKLFAHIMIFSFIARIIYMLSKGIKFPNPFKSKVSFKERLQGFTYIYFYIFVFVSAFTGICLEKGFLLRYHENIESIHKLGLYWFPIFIILHFTGIIIAETTNKKGIASKMIGGE